MSCPHTEADDQRILRRMVQKRQRQSRHHLSDGSKYRHPNAVDHQASLHSVTRNDDRCRTVSQQITSREIPLIALGAEHQHQGRQSNCVGGESARSNQFLGSRLPHARDGKTNK